MRQLEFCLLSIIAVGPLPRIGRAEPSPIKKSLLTVNQALAVARDDSPECKDRLLGGLKDARDALQQSRGRVTVEVYTKARRAVEDALDAASGACADNTQAKTKAALDDLEAQLAALSSGAGAETPEQKRLREKRGCWNYRNDWSSVDPGCHMTKRGNAPINKEDFQKILAAVQAGSDRFAKSRALEQNLGYSSKRYVTCLQLATLLRHLHNDVDRLEGVKLVAKRLVDPGHSSTVAQTIQDARMRKDALEEIALRANQ